MSNAILSRAIQMKSSVPPTTKWVAAVVLAGWFTLVVMLGAGGAFVGPPGTPPLAIGIGFAAPIIVFFAGFWLSRSFRDFVLAVDLRPTMGLQTWRLFVGLGYLALYAYGVMPGMFALPAGLGDIAIGVTAPWVLLTLIRRPGFAAGKTFVVWNALGVLDLVVAMGTAGLSAILAVGVAGEVISNPNAQLPLVLIPEYFVPILIMLHAAAIFQARRLAGYLGEQAPSGAADDVLPSRVNPAGERASSRGSS